ncbi:hypothetical protein [Sphingomonas sp.]|jgi:hypothetical protein|uniref:hypothetical protein n=1 Tax=Sphingomonas sp. TaxID=28214 RepID=UPI002DBBD161|nr:hypothetical protein [Sphingomonas sp.]HEU4967521.1 hypothetical protein [Sphingomonas sp.]
MHKSVILIGAVAALGACGQSSDNAAATNSATNTAAAEAAKPAYCFFKDKETKDWAAKAGADGNVVVTGKAYREDARYKAALGPATVSGANAEIAPTITTNDTGFAAPGDWWTVNATIPNSQAVTTVTVKCGDKTLATLTIPRTK